MDRSDGLVRLLVALGGFVLIAYGAYTYLAERPTPRRPLPDVKSYRAKVLTGEVTTKTLACRYVPDESYDDCLATYYRR